MIWIPYNLNCHFELSRDDCYFRIIHVSRVASELFAVNHLFKDVNEEKQCPLSNTYQHFTRSKFSPMSLQ